MAANLDILIRAQNQASSALRAVGGDLDSLNRKAGVASRGFGSLQSAMGTGLKMAGGLAVAGVVALGAGFAASTVDGLKLNSTLENVTAQLYAFTKDGDKAEAILADIRTEAAKTPFAFQEMAKATASLLPAAKASGMELMDLVHTAEILAASNPAQGLEGAAFSLREALSGDFVSIIDRFNLPRQRLNELKAEGVPAIEAITIAMREMGLDADLVGNMALTMTGRWSTFKDTIDTLKATMTKPLFDVLKSSLTGMQGVLDANAPKLTALAELIGGKLAAGVQWLIDGAVALSKNFDRWGESARRVGRVLLEMWAKIKLVLNPLWELIGGFFKWEDVLLAVGFVLASVLVPALMGIVAAAAPVLLTFAALVAGAALLQKAWEGNWGGIRDEITQVGEALQTWFNQWTWDIDIANGFAKLSWGDVFDFTLDWSAKVATVTWADVFDFTLDWNVGFTTLTWGDVFDFTLSWKASFVTLTWGDVFGFTLQWKAGFTQLTWKDVFDFTLNWTVGVAKLTWEDVFSFKLDWEAKFTQLKWGDVFTFGLDWEAGFTTLKWGDVFGFTLQWEAKFTQLTWSDVFDFTLNWEVGFTQLTWGDVFDFSMSWDPTTTKLTWGDVFDFSLSWNIDLLALTWKDVFDFDLRWTPTFTKQTTWADVFNFDLKWSVDFTPITWAQAFAFILNWKINFTQITWGEAFAFTMKWAATIGQFSWADVFDFTLNWKPSVSISWPEVPAWVTWLMGGGLDNSGGGGGGGGGGFNAAGTSFFPGGLTLVGERGPELVALPRGSQIHNSESTSRMMGGGGINVTVNANMSNDIDAEAWAYRIAQIIQKRQRGF